MPKGTTLVIALILTFAAAMYSNTQERNPVISGVLGVAVAILVGKLFDAVDEERRKTK